MSHRHLIIGVALAGVATAAFAQAPQSLTRTTVSTELATSFKQADTNNNGSLSQAEIAAAETKANQARLAQFRTRLDQEFTKADTNRDGQLSKAEFTAAAAPPAPPVATGAELLANLDKNKNGSVSLDEFRNPQLAAFDSLDTNRDGTISDSERQAAPKPLSPGEPKG